MATEVTTTKAEVSNMTSSPPKVQDIMTAEVFTLIDSDTFDMADSLMKWRRIRHIPVVNTDNNLVGLVTHRDFLKVAVSRLSEIDQVTLAKTYRNISVSDIMQTDILAVGPDLLLAEAAQMMHENKFGCLPVVEDDKIVGIITEADFVRAFYEWDVNFQS